MSWKKDIGLNKKKAPVVFPNHELWPETHDQDTEEDFIGEFARDESVEILNAVHASKSEGKPVKVLAGGLKYESKGTAQVQFNLTLP